jgi:ribulose-5-phosphate 4-epimerase/fuculose-1-phosphate aldolase
MSAPPGAEILTALAILRSEGVFEKAYGHVSVRLHDGGVCILRHIHGEARTLDSVREDDLIVIDLEGRVRAGAGEPPGEYPIHTEIYRRRADVGAIVHCHPTAPIALSIAGENVKPVSMRSVIFAPEVPTFDDPMQIDSPGKGGAVAETLGTGRAVVLRGHGVVCVGADLVEATVTAIDLSETAQLQLAASAIGPPRVIGDEYLEGRRPGREFFSGPWHYYVARHTAAGGQTADAER